MNARHRPHPGPRLPRAALAACAALAAAIIAGGCSSTSGIEGVSIDDPASGRSLAALMEAPDRMELVCTSTEPLSTQRALLDLVFSCQQLKVEATLTEMRDAGWRLKSVDVGQEQHSPEGVLGLPLTITMIKLF